MRPRLAPTGATALQVIYGAAHGRPEPASGTCGTDAALVSAHLTMAQMLTIALYLLQW